jgi:hypothetical protein
MEGLMKTITAAVAALALGTMMNVGTAPVAKADGGAIAIGVGVYLLADALVGRKCHRDEWPFNFVRKLGDELHGRPGCHRYHHGHDDHYGKKHRRHHMYK